MALATGVEPWQLDACDAVDLIGRGELSPVELTESLLRRIAHVDGDLQAWVTVDAAGALRAATALEQRLSAGERGGVMAGVPVGVKDVIHVAGLPTTASSRVLADHVAVEDAHCVAALRRADAIVLGKAHTAEFACADPAPTRNPWNHEHTPGGSSTGSAVAVAAGAVPVALGTQTGGSTVRPAAYNGVVGLKPTYGMISNRGVIPLAWSMDHVGILARSVRDAALTLRVIAGHDPLDPASSPCAGVHDAAIEAEGPPVLGLIRGPVLEMCHPEVLEHTLGCLARFEADGAEVREIKLPASFAAIVPGMMTILCSETHAYHREQYEEKKELYGPKIAGMIESGGKIVAYEYIRACRERRAVVAELEAALAGVDAVLTPGTPAPAPRDTESTGDAAFQLPWSYAGLPTVGIPSGVNGLGLPLGLQLVGHRWGDADLLRVARWCERHLDYTAHPPCWTQKETT